MTGVPRRMIAAFIYRSGNANKVAPNVLLDICQSVCHSLDADPILFSGLIKTLNKLQRLDKVVIGRWSDYRIKCFCD